MQMTLAPWIATPGQKHYEDGTHRVVPPEATLDRIEAIRARCGITRVANITGLDNIGIPVALACRPNSRSLAVSQGKGLSLDAAKASALMESIESWSAERIITLVTLARRVDLTETIDVVDVSLLPQLEASRYSDGLRIAWIEGFDLMSGRPTLVPYELVHLDMTLPLPEGSGCFPVSSNGLASGNHHAEAALHALCEVIERDAFALWHFAGTERRADMRVDLASVTNAAALDLIALFDAASMYVAVWDITSDVGVPAYRCEIMHIGDDGGRPLYPSSGLGCHPTREIALVRAMTEAAQSRLTRIAGSRDDIPRGDYELSRHPDEIAAMRTALSAEPQRRSYGGGPDHREPTVVGDVEFVVGRLGGVGFDSAVLIDLTHPEIGVPVVRAIVPGLESKPGGSGYRPGARVRRSIGEP